MTVVTVLELSQWPLLQHLLRGEVAGDIPKSGRAGLVSTRLSKRRGSARDIGGGLLFFLF